MNYINVIVYIYILNLYFVISNFLGIMPCWMEEKKKNFGKIAFQM